MPRRVRAPIAVWVASVTLALLLRIHGFGVELSRDEATYMTMGHWLHHGDLPYTSFFDHKQPLVYPLYALLDLIFPQSVGAVRVAAAVLSATVATVVFLLAGRGLTGGLCAFAVLVIGSSAAVEGLTLNTEHLLAVVSALGVAAALRWGDVPGRRAPLGLGVIAGSALLAKATGAFVLPAMIIPVLAAASGWRERRRSLLWFAAGGAIPIAATVALYGFAGGLPALRYANLTYNHLYVGSPFSGVGATLGDNPQVAVLILSALAVALTNVRGLGTRELTLLAWLVGGAAGAVVSARAYPHYFAPVLAPAVLILGDACLRGFAGRRTTTARVAAVTLLVAVTLPSIGDIERRGAHGTAYAERAGYGRDAHGYQDADVLSPRIRHAARAGDRLYVSGANPGFYWRSGVQPASRYLYDLPAAVDPERFARGVRQDLCANPPRFLAQTIDGIRPAPLPACFPWSRYQSLAHHGDSQVWIRRG